MASSTYKSGKHFLQIKPKENQNVRGQHCRDQFFDQVLEPPSLINPFNAMNGLKNKNEQSTLYETVANPTESTQNLSPGRFSHAEVESDVKNLRIHHPDLEIKENNHYFLF